MMDFGQTLRAAREAKGLSIAQIAEMTRLAPTTITSLEHDDFQHIAAPIYGRGFVRLYCEAVGLDPKPFICEYMDIMQGNRTPTIKERAPVVTEVRQEELSEAVPPPVASEPPRRTDDPFRQTLVQQPATQRRRAEAPAAAPRYAAPLRTLGLTVSATWRLATLAIGAGIALALLVFGLRALHRTTAPSRTPEESAVTTAAEATPAPAAPAASAETDVRRQQQAIPPLYID